MKTVVIEFVIHDEEEDDFEHELRHSHLLQEWPVLAWAIKESTPDDIEWYNKEYLDV